MPSRVSRRCALLAAASLALTRRAHAQSSDIDVGDTQIPVPGGAITGVFARPAGATSSAVVLVAENGTGLDRVVTDACRDLAKAGFMAVAPTLFADAPSDGTLMHRLDAAVAWAAQHGGDQARLGIVGFGVGGRAAWLYDAYNPRLKAAVAWNGPMQGATSPERSLTALDVAGKLHAPLLGLYGKDDGVPRRVLLDAEAKAKQAGKIAEIVVYVGAGPDFAVPGSRGFNQAATIDGWQRTIAWLRKHGAS